VWFFCFFCSFVVFFFGCLRLVCFVFVFIVWCFFLYCVFVRLCFLFLNVFCSVFYFLFFIFWVFLWCFLVMCGGFVSFFWTSPPPPKKPTKKKTKQQKKKPTTKATNRFSSLSAVKSFSRAVSCKGWGGGWGGGGGGRGGYNNNVPTSKTRIEKN